jgi:hypothetical protein
MVPSSSTPITGACSRTHRPPRWYLPTPHRNSTFLFLQSIPKSRNIPSQSYRLIPGFGFCLLLHQALRISARRSTPARFFLLLPQALRISWDFLASPSGRWMLLSVHWLLGLLVIIDTAYRLLPLVRILWSPPFPCQTPSLCRCTSNSPQLAWVPLRPDMGH